MGCGVIAGLQFRFERQFVFIVAYWHVKNLTQIGSLLENDRTGFGTKISNCEI